ncbi:acyltransferase family protein [Promicromonospora sp. MS192]|uniref:acyltransferase family protein n=1 Tax=Promicromonospora sp. MS192 TaxID=3412684 RepID=UPI003C2E8AE7
MTTLSRPSPRHVGPAVTEGAPSASARSSWVPELHGLRGLALALVVMFHLFGHGRVSGGVDVFLVVSGYLATATLLRRAERRALDPVAYWGRTFVRLAPPALVVLAATTLLMVLTAPQNTWLQTLREIFATATYWVNWEMISGQLAYGAAGPGTSPVQHFWSLSVQAQFFLAWPLVILLTAWLARRARVAAGPALTVVTAVATVWSFVFAAQLAAADQAVAYFHSGARFWELGAGALAFLLGRWVRVPDRVRPALAWTGLALVVACGFVLDGGSLFPGPLALWPVLGTLFVMFGSGGDRAATTPTPLMRFLGWRPLTWVADRSYSLYIWHWPLLIAYLNLRDRDQVGIRGAVVILAVAVLLAWLTDLTVARGAQAFRDRRGDRPALVAAVLAIALVAVPTGLWANATERQQAAELAALDEPVPSEQYPGALVLTQGASPRDATVRPDPVVAAEDLPESQVQPGCVQGHGREMPNDIDVLTCDITTPETPTRTVAMVGASHIMQWVPAFERIAEENDWHLVLVAKQGCRMQDPATEVQGFPSCRPWNESLVGVLDGIAPDAVVVDGTETGVAAGTAERILPGQLAAWQKLDAQGVPVLALRDNMRFETNPVDCVAEHGADGDCGRARADLLGAPDPLTTTAGIPDSLVPLDLTDALCTADECPAVVGNVLVYRDDDHISATYVRTVAPYLDTLLHRDAPWLFAG